MRTFVYADFKHSSTNPATDLNLVVVCGGEDAPVLLWVHPLDQPRAPRLERLHLLRGQEVLHRQQAVPLKLQNGFLIPGDIVACEKSSAPCPYILLLLTGTEVYIVMDVRQILIETFPCARPQKFMKGFRIRKTSNVRRKKKQLPVILKSLQVLSIPPWLPT